MWCRKVVCTKHCTQPRLFALRHCRNSFRRGIKAKEYRNRGESMEAWMQGSFSARGGKVSFGPQHERVWDGGPILGVG